MTISWWVTSSDTVEPCKHCSVVGPKLWVTSVGDHHDTSCPHHSDGTVGPCKFCGILGRIHWVTSVGDHHDTSCPRYSDVNVGPCKHCGVDGPQLWVTSNGNHHKTSCPQYSDATVGPCKHCGAVGEKKSITLQGSHHQLHCLRHAAYFGPGQYLMYHGTSEAAAQAIRRVGFRPSSNGMLGKGVYLSRSKEKAEAYGPHILEICVDVGRVKCIDRQGHPMQKTWASHGYDSAWVPPKCGMVSSGLEEDCVADPSRIVILN